MNSSQAVMYSAELQEYANRCDQPDVFTRAALEQTFIVLRKINPAMALRVQNIMHSDMISKPNALNDEHRTDSFRIQLEAVEVQAIIHSLVSLVPKIGQKKLITNLTLLGNLVILKSLIEDWVRVADTYLGISECEDINVKRTKVARSEESENQVILPSNVVKMFS